MISQLMGTLGNEDSDGSGSEKVIYIVLSSNLQGLFRLANLVQMKASFGVLE